MDKAFGMRTYLYEFIFHQAIDEARFSTGEIIPISQAKQLRRQVDQALLDRHGKSLQTANLGVNEYLAALEAVLTDQVPDYEPQFVPAGLQSPRYQALQNQFLEMTSVAKPGVIAGAKLPISPYDPQWAERATVKRQGAALTYVKDQQIQEFAGGKVEGLSAAKHRDLKLWKTDADGKLVEAGQSFTNDDAAGLTALMDKMSEKEYAEVREWVLDGGRDPRTGHIEPSRFMSPAAVARSAAVLDELKRQGLSYAIKKDREPGQIKAVLEDTKLEIRITDTREESYAGARLYDSGMITRYSTNHRVAGGVAIPSVTPEQAVALLRYALGQEVMREDAPGFLVGQAGPQFAERERNGNFAQRMSAYHLEQEAMSVVGDYAPEGERIVQPGPKLMVRRESKNRTLPMFFVDAERAEQYGRAAVDSARANLEQALEAEALIEHAMSEIQRTEGRRDEMTPPAYAADAEVAAIQRSYWDVLTGARAQLLRAGATEEMYLERLESIGEMQEGEVPDLGSLAYFGDPADKVRQHAADVPLDLIGTWDPEPHYIDGVWKDERFDPSRVARYMTSPTGQWTNQDNMASALRSCEIPADELMGTGFQVTRFKDRTVRFNPATAREPNQHPSEFMARMGRHVGETIERNGAICNTVLIDDQGVIQWTGQKIRRDGSQVPISGEIGQVFDVGQYGEIVTRYASGENALIVPGYEARIAANMPGESPRSVEERTILRGYEQLMRERIQYQLSGDLVTGRSQVGEPASLNAVYSQLYGTKHPVDFIEQNMEFVQETGEIKLSDWAETILATEARRVRYSNEIRQGSTIFAEYQAEEQQVDPVNDNVFDAWKLTGGRNMALLTGRDANRVDAPAGYFDPVMTGGAINQGIVRYLTTAAQVDAEGRIVPGDPDTLEGSRAPLMCRPEMDTLRYDPFDRQQMTASTIMQSSKITEPTGTALMTFGGWTADDPIVVSKEFAEKHQIRGAGGQLRDLVVGDKLSDLHGNKGVVSLVVDRDMDLEEAREQGLEHEVAWFKDNAEMDVVMSPFSLISRRNAGSARELMVGGASQLSAPDALAEERLLAAIRGDDAASLPRATPGGLGQMRFVVTHMAVDEKTKIYDDEQVRAGKGRKASSQLAWALQSQDCPSIMREFYGHNVGPEANLREFLLVSGLGMDADGTLRVIGQAESGDADIERRLIEMPDLKLTSKGSLNTTAMRREFGQLIGDRGGDLEMPFPLKFPTGEQTEALSATTWKLPVLSAHLRSGQEFDDGSLITHDYTRAYQDLYLETCRYRYAQQRLESGEITPQDRVKLRHEMSESTLRAQRSFESITNDVKHRVFESKNNIFKTGIMSSRLADSATMVWTADPRLDIDQIALSRVKAEQLGLREGDHALVWRDPILRDAGVRYMRVALDDRLTGAAINPVMDACFDGDFDGDAVAVVKLHTEAAKQEALQKLSVPANLLDTGAVLVDGSHPLAMQVSLDTQVALSKDPALAARLESVRVEANQLEQEARRWGLAEEAVDPEISARQGDIARRLSDFYRYSQRDEFGAALSFANRETHLQSVREVCVDTGAKGNEQKLADYARNFGDEAGRTGITQADQEASMFATAIKAHGTGLGGSFSQRAVRALRDEDLKAVLEVTYPVTQSILQAKHDAAEARHKYAMLQGPGRELWRGRLLEHTGPSQWKTVFEDGAPVQATAEQWQEQFIEFYRSKEGFGVEVNPEYVTRVARALEDPVTGRMRNLDSDPALTGSTLDRLAYGKSFDLLLEAAQKREGLFDGSQAAEFASMPTRSALAQTERELQQSGVTIESPELDPQLIKRDVLADATLARARGTQRRSPAAVAVGRAVPSFAYADEPQTTQDDSYGFGD